MSTFVAVGNARQPFTRLLEAVHQILPVLPKPVIVQYGHGEFTCPDASCQAMDFVDMERFSALVEKAEVLILHAGAGSIIHALSAEKKPIVMPRRSEYGEHVNDHQCEFANALAMEDRVIVVENVKELTAAVARSDIKTETEKTAQHPAMLEQIDKLLKELDLSISGHSER